MLEGKKKQHESDVEQLRAELQIAVEVQEIADKSKDALHKKEIKAKDALIVVSNKFCKEQLASKDRDLKDAAEDISFLEKKVEQVHGWLVNETTEAADYRARFESFVDKAAETCSRFQQELYTANQRLSIQQIELNETSDKYSRLTERHSTLASEYSSSVAGLENEIEALKEELANVKAGRQTPSSGQGSALAIAGKTLALLRPPRQPPVTPPPGLSSANQQSSSPRNAPKLHAFTFTQPAAPYTEHAQTASQNPFATNAQSPFALSQGGNSNTGAVFNGLPGISDLFPNLSQPPQGASFTAFSGESRTPPGPVK